jgi:hypothetical protein
MQKFNTLLQKLMVKKITFSKSYQIDHHNCSIKSLIFRTNSKKSIVEEQEEIKKRLVNESKLF